MNAMNNDGSRWWYVLIALPVTGVLAGLTMPRAQVEPGLRWALLAGAATLVAGAVALWLRDRRRGTRPRVERVIRLPHTIQVFAHGGVYAYWATAWPDVGEQVPLILVQLAFAYGLDMLLGWGRHGNWRAGFGPWPIVGSTNLFLWFRDPYFALQLGMIGASSLARTYITWERGGRRTHIFNPSGISLAGFSLVLIALGQTEITRAAEISVRLGDPEFIFEAIFLLGVAVQSFVPVVLITASAAVTVYLASALHQALTGLPYFLDTAVPIAVFLGMTLLITDPASSPRGRFAQVLYGVAYGLCVLALYPLLEWFGSPQGPFGLAMPLAHFDKLLQVPLLNLMVPLFDAAGRRLWGRDADPPRTWWSPRLHQVIWAVAFVGMVGAMKFPEGRTAAFWVSACEQGREEACKRYESIMRDACAKGEGVACLGMGISYEHGDLLPARPLEAAKAYEAACKHGVPDGCAYLGVLFVNGAGGPADPVLARTLFAQACDAGSHEGCEKLGLALLSGLGGPRDLLGAHPVLERACEGDAPRACLHLSIAYARGDGVAPDAVRAEALRQRACERGIEDACRGR